MTADPREYVTAWRWELELQPRATGSVKPGRVRPLFTFLAVPERPSHQMKLPSFHASRFTLHVSRPSPPPESGSAVIVVIALLAIILIYVAGNLRTLANLGRELRLLERQQTRRLQTAAPKTNSPPASLISTNSISKPGPH